MANEKKNDPHDLSAQMQKAVRRGERLEKTLTKIVALSEPGSPAEELLKSVQAGVEQLRKDAEEFEHSRPSKKPSSKQRSSSKKVTKEKSLRSAKHKRRNSSPGKTEQQLGASAPGT